MPLAVLAMIATGLVFGAFNATLVAFGGLSLFRALALIFTRGQPIFGPPEGFRALTNGDLAGAPHPVILAHILLNKTPLGEYFLAVGGNPEAARIAGVPVRATKFAAYMISGAMGSTAATVMVGRLGAAEPTMSKLWELDAIAAAAAIGGPRSWAGAVRSSGR